MKLPAVLLLPALLLWSGCAREGEVEAPRLPVGAAVVAEATEVHYEPGQRPPQVEPVRRAIAVLVPVGGSGISGVVQLVREDGQVRIFGTIVGLKPNSKHGFHVHQYGDLTDLEKGRAAGDHFNPTDQPHGAPDDPQRHVGDLGNITADEHGVAHLDLRDSTIKLTGPTSVVGRSLVVHERADRFVQPSGDAGNRVALGVIGLAQPQELEP